MRKSPIVLTTLLSSLGMSGYALYNYEDKLSPHEKECLEESNRQVVCTILDETYISSGLQKVDEVHIRGVLSEAYSGPSLTTKESIYIIKAESPKGNIFSLNIIDSYRTPKEAIDQLFNKGDKIAFRGGNNWKYIQDSPINPQYVAADGKETGYYNEGDLFVTRSAMAISRPKEKQ